MNLGVHAESFPAIQFQNDSLVSSFDDTGNRQRRGIQITRIGNMFGGYILILER